MLLFRSKRIVVTSLTFQVTWRHRSRERSIAHRQFHVGGPLESSRYLEHFTRYLMANVTQWLAWP